MGPDHQTPLDLAQSTIYGRDVLEVIKSVEGKTSNPNAQLTLLTSAICLVAIGHGVRLRDLRRGLEAAFRQSVQKAPNFARKHGAEGES